MSKTYLDVFRLQKNKKQIKYLLNYFYILTLSA